MQHLAVVQDLGERLAVAGELAVDRRRSSSDAAGSTNRPFRAFRYS